MKRKAISLTFITLISLLGACEANESNTDAFLQEDNEELVTIQTDELEKTIVLQDGQYFAKEDCYTDGWKNIINFTVVNGKIDTLSFDAVNEEATHYQRASLTDSNETELNSLDTQLQQLESYLLKHQETLENLNVEDLQEIEGIDLDVSPLIDLVYTAIEQGPIEIGAYQDGAYFAEIDDEANDTKHTLNMIVENGYIISAHWNADALSHSLSEEELTEKQDNIEQWRQQSAILEQYLIKYQDPMEMTFDEQNKAIDISGVTIDVHQFIELATKALASGPLLN